MTANAPETTDILVQYPGKVLNVTEHNQRILQALTEAFGGTTTFTLTPGDGEEKAVEDVTLEWEDGASREAVYELLQATPGVEFYLVSRLRSLSDDVRQDVIERSYVLNGELPEWVATVVDLNDSERRDNPLHEWDKSHVKGVCPIPELARERVLSSYCDYVSIVG